MNQPVRTPSRTLPRRLAPLFGAFCATLLAQPVSAGITIPNTPLTAGMSVPPNVMFILDDSLSMEESELNNPDLTITGGGLGDNEFATMASTYNTLYYNPATTYNTWKQGDGSFLATRAYSSAWSSDVLASGSTTDLSGGVQSFFVPKTAASVRSDATQYYRYQILTSGAVIRSERIQVTSTTTNVFTVNNLAANRNNWTNSGGTGANAPSNVASGRSASFTVPAGVYQLRARISGSDPNANVYLRYNALPTTGTYNCIANGNSSNETATCNSPAAGTWYVGVRAADSGNGDTFTGVTLVVEYEIGNAQEGVTSVGCDTSINGWGWRNCTQVTPTGRSEAAERQNFATWYSFHRTRSKAAKAGTSYAFADLGENFRVGLSGLYSIRSNIPVTSDGGLFRDRSSPASTNRTAWFNSLFTMPSAYSTPLRGALHRTGTYFSSNASDGPYGGTGTTQLACRQNFAILTTDGYWNNLSTTGYPADPSFSFLSGDEDAGATISGPNNPNYTYSAVRPYTAAAQETLADVAMHYWKTDLRSDLNNVVPTSTGNPAFWQHMVTFGISLGLQGNLDPATDLPALTAGTLSWGAVSTANDSDPDKIDDLWHAAVNSRGSFAAATDPTAFANAIRNALAAVVEIVASGANVTTNSTALTSSSRIYQARYVSGPWYGELSAYDATADDTSPALWNASAGIPSYASRNIYTWNPAGLGAGAVFPTSAQAAALNAPTAGVSDYIRGNRANEGTTFRTRNRVLGDIINSTPANDTVTSTIYIGANDGMLHAINSSNGVERFAYVPGNIDLGNLENMAFANYAHAYFVDGPIVISPRSITPNNSYLIGALGRGGKGVYALNVTTPTSFNETNVMWEYSATTHPKMGNVLNEPIITKLNNGGNAILVPNGPNSTNDTAVLYVLNLTTGAVLAEIDTGTGTGWGGAAAPNGLSGLRGYDADGNGTTDYVYAGDLRGNVWKFDISSTNAADWDDADKRSIVFTAVDGSGNRQAISGAPAAAIDPLTYNLWLFFGTGRYLNNDDIRNSDGTMNTSTQTWYGIIENGTAITGRAQLQQRRIMAQGTVNGKTVRGFEAPTTLDTTKRGWYIDLLTPPPPGTAAGERMLGDNVVLGTTVIASSMTPTVSDCQTDGTGFVNAIDAFTGASVAPNFFDLDGDGSYADDVVQLADGTIVPVGSAELVEGAHGDPVFMGSTLYVGGSRATRGQADINLNSIYGRKSWREAVND